MSVNVLVRDLRTRHFHSDTAILARVIRRTLKKLPTRVLVVGCGDGREAAQLAISLDADVVGVDRRDRFDRASRAFATLLVGDPGALTFGDAAFDFVFSRLEFETVASLRASLYQVSRVLAHGGGFCLSLPARRGLNAPELRSEVIAALGEAGDVTDAFHEDRYAELPRLARAFCKTLSSPALVSSRYFIGRRAVAKR